MHGLHLNIINLSFFKILDRRGKMTKTDRTTQSEVKSVPQIQVYSLYILLTIKKR